MLGLGLPLEKVGLITLDAHFDMRDLSQGLTNGNPVRALIEDGLPGANIAQIGLASFANSAAMHRDAVAAGNLVVTIGESPAHGIEAAIDARSDHVAHCEALVVDCDIDVIDRAQFPGRPGARPGGMAVADFFRRSAGWHPIRACASSTSPNGTRRSTRPTSARSPPRAGWRSASRATSCAELPPLPAAEVGQGLNVR